jgi:hypothetical protein
MTFYRILAYRVNPIVVALRKGVAICVRAGLSRAKKCKTKGSID